MLLGTVTGGGMAYGQTTPTYSPGTSVPACTSGAADAGSVAPGQTATFNLCGVFKPGSNVILTVDGQAAGTKVASSAGVVPVVITVTSATTASVNDPVIVNVNCGANTVVATGTGPSGGTQTGTFAVPCAATTASGVAFTGANVMKGLLVALLLIAVGAALVLAQRRRRRRSSKSRTVL